MLNHVTQRFVPVVVAALLLCWIKMTVASIPGARSPQAISADGQYKVSVPLPDVQNKTDSPITLFTKQDRQWKEVWKVTVPVNLHPDAVHVDNEGHVITVDTWNGRRGENQLVIYHNGKLVQNHSGSDLLKKYGKPGQDISSNAFHTSFNSISLFESRIHVLIRKVDSASGTTAPDCGRWWT